MGNVYHNDVKIHNGAYGDLMKDQNGNDIFFAKGNAVEVNHIKQILETDQISLLLEFEDVTGKNKQLLWERKDLIKSKILGLTGYGVQVNEKTAITLIKCIENSESSAPVKNYHLGLGWLDYEEKNIFRAFDAVGINSEYEGDLLIKPKGSFDVWLKMVEEYVIGNRALETMLCIGLSSVVYGYLHETFQTESLFVHLCGDSTSGKTTAGMLGVSVGCYPDFDKNSLAFTWSGTHNAIIRNLADNFGYPVLLDEGSMSNHKDKTSFIYTLTSGKERDRLNKDLSKNSGGSWKTTVISTGEMSLIDNSTQNTGLRMRLIEFNNIDWTTSAKTADAIKSCVNQNYGHAVTVIAEALLKLDEKNIKEAWKKIIKKCSKRFEHSKFKDRIVKKYAIICFTALLVKKCLKVKIDYKSVLDFLYENDSSIRTEESLDIGQRALEVIREQVLVNKDKFEVCDFHYSGQIIETETINSTWGRIINHYIQRDCDSREEIEKIILQILPEKLKEILDTNGFESRNVVLNKWDEQKILVRSEKDRKKSRVKFMNSNTRVSVYQILLQVGEEK